MNPSSDVGNTGTSINFDAGAFHEAEEAEYHREEQERQNELRELLTNALDLTEDEDEDDSEENMSHQSQDMNRPQEWSDQDEREPPAGSQEGENWDNFPVATVSNNVQSQSPPFQQMSPRPIGGTKLVPPAAFTYTGSHQGEFSHHPVDYSPHPQYNLGVSDPYHDYNAATQWSDDHAHQYHDYGERGEIEGGNDQEYHHHHYQDDKGEAQGLYYHHQKYVPERDNHNVYHGKRDIFDDNSYSELERDRVYHGDSYSDIPTDGVIKAHDTNYISTPQAIIPTHDTDASDSYKVSYHPPQLLPVHLDNERILSSEKPRPPPARDGPGAPDPAQQPRPTTPGEEERMQADFLNATDGGADTRHMTQLEILYRARGKQLEEVSEQFKVLQDDSAREARILKHKLALTEDERDGLKVSLDQNAALLSIGKKNEAELQGKITALESQIEALQAGKQELMKKLSSAESTIESVNQQLADLGASESLSRSREQHEAVVASLNQRHQQQVYMLNEKLDSLSHDNEAKSDEIGSLKRQLAEAVTRSEQATVERADTINRLTRSLEDSQSQIECLLEAGTGKAAAALKVQLQEVIAGKSIAEDLNAALQDEIRDLKEQVRQATSRTRYATSRTRFATLRTTYATARMRYAI